MKNFPNNFETGINIKKNEEFMMTHQKQNRNNFVTSNTNNYTITNNNNITNSGLINRDKDIFVESLVDTTATIIETIWCNFPVVTTAQIIPLRLFIKETLKRSRTFLSTLKIAQLYLLRIQSKINSLHSSITTTTTTTTFNNNNCNNNNIYGPSSSSLSDNKNIDPATCGRRMFLASLIIASKYLQDKNYSNTAWSKICGLQVKEINMVERRFLQLIGYNLYVSEELFDSWTNFLNTNLNTKLSSFDNNNNNNNNGGGKNYNNNNNNNIHDNNNSNCMNFQASNNNNNNVISMNVVQTSSNMDAHSFENPNLSTVLTAPPMIIMSRSKECHVRG